MPTLDEAAAYGGGSASLLAGLRVLSLDATVVFWRYVRKVLPLDGYVFWLATEPMEVRGSLHVSADRRQLEDETISVNRVVLTTGEEVQAFNDIAPNELWIGEAHGVKFAFSQSGAFYRPAGLRHYVGDAVYPALESQLVPVGTDLSTMEPIVSNSLPAWLRLIDYSPIWLLPANPRIELFPSFLVPANLPPPYGSVHIDPASTRALGAEPRLGSNSTHTQLASDRVRVTLYGATNDQATAFHTLVNQFSRDTVDVIGMMEPAILRDEKRTQAELGVIAMKKTIEFIVSYNQTAIRDCARQMILEACETFIPQHCGVT